MYIKVLFVIVLSSMHFLFGVISIITGISSTIQALVWVAHAISPIWSGAFFIITGITGLAMCKQRSQYSILCFAAFSCITLITCVVNMQLLRLGLVNHTTLGRTFQKENKDVYIIIGMVADAGESILCLISLLICIKLNHDAKHNRFKSHKKEGAFFVQIVSDKDIVVVQSKPLNGGVRPTNNLVRLIMDEKITNVSNNSIQNRATIDVDALDKLTGDIV